MAAQYTINWKNYYDILKVPRGCEDETRIHGNYKRLMQIVHPDVNPELREQEATDLNEAYECLIDQSERAAYWQYYQEKQNAPIPDAETEMETNDFTDYYQQGAPERSNRRSGRRSGRKRSKVAAFIRIILKIIAVPIVVVLSVLWAALVFLFAWTKTIMGIVSGILMIAAIVMFITGETTLGIISAIIAFLLSPVGIPLIAGWIIKKISDLNGAIKDFIKS